MKIFSFSVTLALLTLLGIASAQVCSSKTPTCADERNLKMCVKQNGRLVTKCVRKRPKILRRILERGGSCGHCGNQKPIADETVSDAKMVAVLDKCEVAQNQCLVREQVAGKRVVPGVKMCQRNPENQFVEECVDKNRMADIKKQGGRCGACSTMDNNKDGKISGKTRTMFDSNDAGN